MGSSQSKNQQHATVSPSFAALPSTRDTAKAQKSKVEVKEARRQTEILNTFESLDRDKSGTLDFDEVQAGLQKLGYPPRYAFDVFVQLDKDNDREISFLEFKAWVEDKSEDMRQLFDSVDQDHSGHIDLKELELMLYHLDMPVTNAREMMDQLDQDGDEQISFQEFQTGFSLMCPTHFSALKDTWMEYESDSDCAGVSAIDVSKATKREESKTVPAWTSVVAGGLGNAFSRTAMAPLERTRVQMMADAGKFSSMTACMHSILRTEGILGFWAGNALNVSRIAPQMVLAFHCKDSFKTLYAGQGQQPTALQVLAASMSSGIVCQTALYPIDLIRTRMMTTPGAFASIADCFARTIQEEGALALYKGLLPANLFAVPYYGTQFFVYDTLKLQYATFQKRPNEPPRPANPLIGIPLGAISSMTACFVAFPFQMAWKRLQVQGVGGRPVLYQGTVDCIRQVVKTEGIARVYAGLTPSLLKLAPTGAICFLAVEAIKDSMGWRPGRM